MIKKVQGRRKRGRLKRRRLDKVKDDIKEKGLSADDVYDRATWRRMSSYIDTTYKWEYDEGEEEDAARHSRERYSASDPTNESLHNFSAKAP